MPVIPSRYTCPLCSSNVVAPRKALQAIEASEASEVRIKTLQREDTQCNGSRDVCCYFFGGKTETKAIGSFIIPPRINHQFSAWSSKASWSHGHGAWHAMTLANQESADTNWAIMGHPEIYHGHGSHLPLFGSSLFFLVTSGHIFWISRMCTVINFDHLVLQERRRPTLPLSACSASLSEDMDNLEPLHTHQTHPSLLLDARWFQWLFALSWNASNPEDPCFHLCKGYELVSAKVVPILVTCSAIKGLKIRSANCCQTNMLCTLKAMRDTS